MFFVQGFLFASWTAHIPHLKEHLGLSDGRLGVVLLGAPLGSILALLVAGHILSRLGSRPLVRIALLGYCVSGPFIGLTDSFGTFFIAFLLWGFFQGLLDVSMNTQAIVVERFSGRVLMPGFHGSWSSGALVGALVGASAVGLGVSLSEQLLVLAIPCLLVVGWLMTRMIPDQGLGDDAESSKGGREGRHGMLQRELVVLGGIAFADMLCEGAVADWPPSISTTPYTPSRSSPEWVSRSMPSPCWPSGSAAIGFSHGSPPTVCSRCSPPSPRSGSPVVSSSPVP